MPRLRIELKPSLRIAAALGAAHILALAAAWLSLDGAPLYFVVCGVALSAVGCLLEILHLTSRSAVALELFEDGRAAWLDPGAGRHEGRVGAEHLVSKALVVMRLDHTQEGRKWLVLSEDSGASEDMRRLRVWLRWHREAAAARAGARAGGE